MYRYVTAWWYLQDYSEVVPDDIFMGGHYCTKIVNTLCSFSVCVVSFRALVWDRRSEGRRLGSFCGCFGALMHWLMHHYYWSVQFSSFIAFTTFEWRLSFDLSLSVFSQVKDSSVLSSPHTLCEPSHRRHVDVHEKERRYHEWNCTEA